MWADRARVLPGNRNKDTRSDRDRTFATGSSTVRRRDRADVADRAAADRATIRHFETEADNRDHLQ